MWVLAFPGHPVFHLNLAAILDFRGVSDTKESQISIFSIYFLDAFHHVKYQKSASIINFFHIWTPIPGLNPKQHCDGNLHNSISGPFRPGIL